MRRGLKHCMKRLPLDYGATIKEFPDEEGTETDKLKDNQKKFRDDQRIPR